MIDNDSKTIVGIWISAAIILFLLLAFQISGCFRLRAGRQAPVPAGCAACHDSIMNITGEAHPELEGGDMEYCRSCHKTDGEASSLSGYVHLEHYASPDFSGNCRSCHLLDESYGFRIIGGEKKIEVTKEDVAKMASYFRLWAESDFLDHRHAQADIGCAGCHGTYFPDDGLSLEDCLKCHGNYEELAEDTEETEPNPHDSHYMDLRCTLCHKGHKESGLYCNTCHKFELDVP